MDLYCLISFIREDYIVDKFKMTLFNLITKKFIIGIGEKVFCSKLNDEYRNSVNSINTSSNYVLT